MAILSIEQARELIVATLIRCNTSEKNASTVADALVAAELAGQSGHGLRRMPSYCAQAKSGKVDGQATPTARPVRPGVLAIDAAYGFAYPALQLALDWLPDAARKQGIAMAGIRRSHHCGVAGTWVEALANQGVVALLFANTPAAMAAWGGRTPIFGTDPIAFAAPLPGGRPPIIVDVSLSKVARGKIMAAQQQGKPIPEDWALDADGRPTTDAAAALAGSMLPLGDAKGTAMALMVELLSAGLVGAKYGSEASSFFDGAGDPPGTGQMLIAIDADCLGQNALERFAVLADLVSADPGARLPGQRRWALRAQVMAQGIEVDDRLLDQLQATGT